MKNLSTSDKIPSHFRWEYLHVQILENKQLFNKKNTIDQDLYFYQEVLNMVAALLHHHYHPYGTYTH